MSNELPAPDPFLNLLPASRIEHGTLPPDSDPPQGLPPGGIADGWPEQGACRPHHCGNPSGRRRLGQERVAAIGDDRLAADPPGFRTTEQGHDARDIIRSTKPTHRSPAAES